MSVLIKGMEMPKDCPQCIAARYNQFDEFTGCRVVPGKLHAIYDSKYAESNVRPDWCPLVPAVQLEDYQSMERTVHKLTQALQAAPVKHGRWIKDSSGAEFCSECNQYPYDDGEYHITNWHSCYCPNCGAKMDEEAEP